MQSKGEGVVKNLAFTFLREQHNEARVTLFKVIWCPNVCLAVAWKKKDMEIIVDQHKAGYRTFGNLLGMKMYETGESWLNQNW